MLLWGSLIFGDAGAQVTVLALASAAILVLHAGAFEVGLLGTFAWAPWVFLALPAGVITDRVRKRFLLILTCFGRAVVLALVPIAFGFHLLSLPLLYAVVALEGSLNVVYSITSTSYVPALVGRERLIDANSKVFTSRSVASLGAPGLGGYLIQLIGPALTVWAATVAFFFGGAMTVAIRTPEVTAMREAHHPSGFLAEIGEGIQVVFGHPTLRLLVVSLAIGNLGGFAVMAIQLLYFYRELHLVPATVGLILAMEGVGAIAGAAIAQKVARRLGLGPTLLLSNLAFALSTLSIPLAGFGFAVPVLATLMVVFGVAIVVFDVNQISMRQGITPDRLQGRMTATIRMVVVGMAPVGSFMGGLLGARIGLVPTILVGGLLAGLSCLGLLPKAIRRYGRPEAA